MKTKFAAVVALLFLAASLFGQGVAVRSTNGYSYGTLTGQKGVFTNLYAGVIYGSAVGLTNLTIQYYNVRDYGASGDGVADDTDFIQTAANAAKAAGGGTVYFPRGTYSVRLNSSNYYNGCINLGTNYNNMALLGEAPGVVRIRNDASKTVNSSVLLVSYSTNFSIANLILDGNWANRTGSDTLDENEGISMVGVTNAVVADTEIVNSGADGFDLDFCQEVHISNCRAATNGGMGFGLAGVYLTINDCLAVQNGVAKYLEGSEPDIGGFGLNGQWLQANNLIAISNTPMNYYIAYNPQINAENITAIQGFNTDWTNIWINGTTTDLNLNNVQCYGGIDGITMTYGVGGNWVPDTSNYPKRVRISNAHVYGSKSAVRLRHGWDVFVDGLTYNYASASGAQAAVQVGAGTTNVNLSGLLIENGAFGSAVVISNSGGHFIDRSELNIGAAGGSLAPLAMYGVVTNVTVRNTKLGRVSNTSISLDPNGGVSNNIYNGVISAAGLAFSGSHNKIINCVIGIDPASTSGLFFTTNTAAGVSTNNIVSGCVFPFYNTLGALYTEQLFFGNRVVTNGIYYQSPTDVIGGSMIFSNNAATQDFDTSVSIVTNWTRIVVSAGITASTNGSFTALADGTYNVALVTDVDSTSAADITGELYVNAVATGYRFNVDIATASDHEMATIHGFIPMVRGDVLTVRVTCGAAETLLFKDGQLNILRR